MIREEITEAFMEELKIKVTNGRLNRLVKISNVVEENREYHPLTVRQVFYQLVGKEFISNNQGSYKKISNDLTHLRLAGIVSWYAIEDRSRRISGKRGYESVEDYISVFINQFDPRFYHRCLIQSQLKHVEVWIEKDALSSIVEDVVWPYCLRVVVCRGHSSTTFIRQYAERARSAIEGGKQPVILYFGDLDPSGIECFEAAQRSLENKHKVSGIIYKRISLNPEHLDLYNLPDSVDAIKESDPNYKKYVSRFGRVAVELDALHPKDLQNLVRESIRDELDLSEVNAQKEIEQIERQKIVGIKDAVKEVIVDMMM